MFVVGGQAYQKEQSQKSSHFTTYESDDLVTV